jgi:hypothetical protein
MRRRPQVIYCFLVFLFSIIGANPIAGSPKAIRLRLFIYCQSYRLPTPLPLAAAVVSIS